MKKILITIYKYFLIRRILKNEKKLLKTNKNYIKLTSEEKKIIRPLNRFGCTNIKNVYNDWENADKRYFISDAFYQKYLLPKLSPINYKKFGLLYVSGYYADKNFQNKFVDIKFPDTVIRKVDNVFYDKDYNKISEKQALNIINKYDELVFKISMGTAQGNGVKLIKKINYLSTINSYSNNYIVQKKINQHKNLAHYNSSSVNIIRLTTVLWKGESYLLSSVFRIGVPGSFCDNKCDNGNEHNYRFGISKNGVLTDIAYDTHTLGNNNYHFFDNFKKINIPKYNEMVELVLLNHKKLPHHGIIGWDLTVDEENNIICMEYNTTCPGIMNDQMINGTTFKIKTKDGKILLDDILNS